MHRVRFRPKPIAPCLRLVAALISLGHPGGYDAWVSIGGIVTVDADWLMLRRCLHFLRVVRGLKLANRCTEIGQAIRRHLGPIAEKIPGAQLSGIGAMWFTNLRFINPNVRQDMRQF